MDAVSPPFCWKYVLGYDEIAIVLCVIESYFAEQPPVSNAMM
jgi:hypothetical protein